MPEVPKSNELAQKFPNALITILVQKKSILNSYFPKADIEANQIKSNQIKSNQINFIGIKSSHRTVTSHMYKVLQEQSQT